MKLGERSRAILSQAVSGDCRDDYESTENRPSRGRFTDKQEHPNRIKKWFKKSDNACVHRADAARNAVREKDIGDADLKNTEVQN